MRRTLHDYGWGGFFLRTVIGFWVVTFQVRGWVWLVVAMGAAGVAAGCCLWWFTARTDELSYFRRPRGQCRRCGYSLKGNASGVCPECGGR